VENPGEVLERVREQLEGGDQANELEERRLSLQKRLATKQAERDRAMRLYMRGLIPEEETDVLLADLSTPSAPAVRPGRALMASMDISYSGIPGPLKPSWSVPR